MSKYVVYYCGKKVKESNSIEYIHAWLMSEGAIVEDRRGTHWLNHDYEVKEEE